MTNNMDPSLMGFQLQNSLLNFFLVGSHEEVTFSSSVIDFMHPQEIFMASMWMSLKFEFVLYLS
jgi:hypothetical protein